MGTFLQPKATAPRSADAAQAAALGALVGVANSLPAEAFTGPLTRSELCDEKKVGLFYYLICPLCDPIFFASPIYNFPFVWAFFATIITIIQVALPASQPDEELRF